ncbi:hypothetical protein PLICRDRAFT_186715 [Plicaturopsis crispa FD-325 SS-3]|nr:hypothetical protein PLICRDRAFT_186715 [Plicaturopsis crispa FD-325 SS-3]
MSKRCDFPASTPPEMKFAIERSAAMYLDTLGALSHRRQYCKITLSGRMVSVVIMRRRVYGLLEVAMYASPLGCWSVLSSTVCLLTTRIMAVLLLLHRNTRRLLVTSIRAIFVYEFGVLPLPSFIVRDAVSTGSQSTLTVKSALRQGGIRTRICQE